jgi:PIN domain nuclease of toxin-antitoxin system
MPFGNRSLHNSRRPAVNPRPLGDTVDDAPDDRKYCPREGRELVYDKEDDVFFCPVCAWNMPEKYTKRNLELQQSQQQQVKGGAATTSEAVKEENIVVVAAPDPRRKKKPDPLDYLRADDSVYTEKTGRTFISDTVIMPSGDKEVVSSKDLKQNKEKVRLRGKTIR